MTTPSQKVTRKEIDLINWQKGDWLKGGLNLSGSQAEYILHIIEFLLEQQRQQRDDWWKEKIKNTPNIFTKKELTKKQKEIYEYFINKGEYNLAKTAKHFNRSTSTIHQYLQTITAKGWLLNNKYQVPAYALLKDCSELVPAGIEPKEYNDPLVDDMEEFT